MPVPILLTALKLLLLLLLYLFLFWAVRSVVTDLYGSKSRGRPPPRPSVAPAAPERRNRRPPRELVVHPPNDRPVVVALGGDAVTLGRGETASVHVHDVYISEEHAEIMPNGDDWTVRDLGSTNGTFLNGAKVAQPTPLAAGDQLRIGKTRVEVRR